MLINGNIPPYTNCPWAEVCRLKEIGDCAHLGTQHNTEFSCALARFYRLIDKEIVDKT